MGTWAIEIETRERFKFGRNWQKFLDSLDDSRIAASEEALREMLEVSNLEGMTFVDAGSGSGLSSLAAMRLGATRVYSFDFDPDSVACTRELRRRYYPNSTNWVVEEGSVLDEDFLKGWVHLTLCILGVFCITPDRCGAHSTIFRCWLGLVAGFLSRSITTKGRFLRHGGG